MNTLIQDLIRENSEGNRETMKRSNFLGILLLSLALFTLVFMFIQKYEANARAQRQTYERIQRRSSGYRSPEGRRKTELIHERQAQGRRALAANDPVKAERWFRKSLEVYEAVTFDPDAYGGLADALTMQGRHKEALEIFKFSEKWVQGSPKWLLRYGKAFEKARLRPQAARKYREALAVPDDFPLKLVGNESDAQVIVLAEVARGIYQRGEGNLTGAIAAFRGVLSKHPNLVVAHERLIQTLEEAGRKAEADKERKRTVQPKRQWSSS